MENLATITITIKDVSDALENLNITKASGPDLISPKLLKEGAPVLSKPIFLIVLCSKDTSHHLWRMQM